jgi:uncharacterized protein with HEPN domain
MTSLKAAKYLWDVRRAAEKIVRFTQGKNFGDYVADEMARSAVERQFEVIGEALAGLRRIDPAMAGNIPDLARIIGFRNILIHGYASVDDRLVWSIVETDLPPLRKAVNDLLGEDPSAQNPPLSPNRAE